MDSTQDLAHQEREVVLIAYASRHAPSEKIATRIADVLAEEGQEAERWRVGGSPPGAPIDSYEGVVVGGPIFPGGYPHAIRNFIRADLDNLQRVPTAFFAVSVRPASEVSEGTAEVRTLEQQLFDETGWSPGMHREFGSQPDVNWSEVDRFARSYVCELLRGTPVHHVPAA